MLPFNTILIDAASIKLVIDVLHARAHFAGRNCGQQNTSAILYQGLALVEFISMKGAWQEQIARSDRASDSFSERVPFAFKVRHI